MKTFRFLLIIVLGFLPSLLAGQIITGEGFTIDPSGDTLIGMIRIKQGGDRNFEFKRENESAYQKKGAQSVSMLMFNSGERFVSREIEEEKQGSSVVLIRQWIPDGFQFLSYGGATYERFFTDIDGTFLELTISNYQGVLNLLSSRQQMEPTSSVKFELSALLTEYKRINGLQESGEDRPLPTIALGLESGIALSYLEMNQELVFMYPEIFYGSFKKTFQPYLSISSSVYFPVFQYHGGIEGGLAYSPRESYSEPTFLAPEVRIRFNMADVWLLASYTQDFGRFSPVLQAGILGGIPLGKDHFEIPEEYRESGIFSENYRFEAGYMMKAGVLYRFPGNYSLSLKYSWIGSSVSSSSGGNAGARYFFPRSSALLAGLYFRIP